ncbi:MAG: Tm-1-like ATP-binding domain-containing protein, partial [Pseudomonadota bacterium]
GGAAYARFITRGAFHTLIDLTPHELTRIMLAGACVPMPERFTAGRHLPRVVLPGALNFIGLGERRLVPPAYLERQHYEHSGYFTHVKLTQDEMARVATQLIADLNAASGPRHLIVPMGGFSHQDRPGGAIEDPNLRMVLLEHARGGLAPDVGLTVVDAHISEPPVTAAIADALHSFSPATKDVTHV